MAFEGRSEADEEVIIGPLLKLVSGFPFASEYFSPEVSSGLPLIRIRDLKTHSPSCRYVGKFDDSYVVKKGDILIGMDGEFLAVRWAGAEALLNQRVVKVASVDPARLDESYLFYRLQPDLVRLEQAITGTTVKHLSTKDIKGLRWSLPPLSEQRRVAEALRSVDEAIACTAATIGRSETLWQTLAESLIWGRSGRADERCPLGTALLATDYGVNVSLTAEAEGFPVLRMGNIQAGHIEASDLKWGMVSPQDAARLALRTGNILFNRTNSKELVGKVALVREPTECLYASYIVRLAVNKMIADPYFIFAVLHSNRMQNTLKEIATPGVSQSNINPTNLKKQLIPLPDLVVQRAISTQMRLAEDARVASWKQIGALETIKRDLSKVLLSGRVRVPA